jgi:murein L,D-transpeptidase YcbB/YkuD
VERSAHDHVITIDQNTPVFVVYMTAWADPNEVYFYEDLYHRDRRLVQAKTTRRG